MRGTDEDRDGYARPVDLTPAEQWACHRAALRRVRVARRRGRAPPRWAVEAVDKLQSGELRFGPDAARGLRRAVGRLGDADAGDRPRNGTGAAGDRGAGAGGVTPPRPDREAAESARAALSEALPPAFDAEGD